MSEQPDEFPMTPEQEKLDRRISGLREQNMKMLNEIRQAGADVELTFPRVEVMMNFLMKEGIITMDQRLKEQEAWELHLRPNLKSMAEQISAARQAAGQPHQRSSGLILPGANGTPRG